MTAELDHLLERLVERCSRLGVYGVQLLGWEIDDIVDAIAPVVDERLDRLVQERIDRQA